MLGGNAWQGGGLYIFTLLIPLFLYSHFFLYAHGQKKIITIMALCFLAIFTIFPVVNFLNYFLPLPDFLADKPFPNIPIKSMASSHFSSSLLATSLFLLLFAYLCGRQPSFGKEKLHADFPTPSRSKEENNYAQRGFKTFTQGMLLASVILAIYILIQHFTGFDYKGKNFLLSSSKQFISTKNYRVIGFFGHPLSLASASLAILCFFWSLFCMSINSTRYSLPIFKQNKQYFFVISLIHMIGIILSGSRSSLCVAIFIILCSPLIFLQKRILMSGKTLVLSIAGTSGGLLLCLSVGIFARFKELEQLWQAGNLDRLKFWTVYTKMFLDRPFLGHGHAWIKYFSRDYYYIELGMKGIERKYNAHNLYLEVLANIGLIGAGIISLAFLCFLKQLKNLCQSKNQIFLFYAFSMALAGNLINGLTQNTYFDSNVLYIYIFFFWFMFWQQLTSQPIHNA